MDDATIKAGETVVFDSDDCTIQIHRAGCADLRKCGPRKARKVLGTGPDLQAEVDEVIERNGPDYPTFRRCRCCR